MKLRVSIALVVLAATLWLTQSARVRTQSANSSGEIEDYRGRSAVAREVLVRLRPGATTGPLHALLDAIDDKPIGSQGWHRIRSASRLVQELVTRLAGRSDVFAVEPNYIVHVDAVPNDPFFPSMWDLLNTAHPGADIHVVPAWDVTTGSTANVVGVVDTGVDYTHPDLAANMWSAPTAFTAILGSGVSAIPITCPAGSHGFNAILLTCDPMDDHYHGTHVSGTIGAVGNNGVGITGVNWTTRLMGLKFLDSTGSGSVADAVNAIDFALKTKAYFAAHGGGANVRVLSNSWGGNGIASVLSDEITAAASADVLFVAAAGNSASNNDTVPTYPASYPQSNIIAVAATTNTDGLASYSNYGPMTVDIGAPGDAYSTVPGGGYGGLSGTSMATPHVSGAAMLLLSACSLNTTQLRNAILNNVDPLASLTGLIATGGRLNVDRAIRSCATVPTVSLTAPADGATYTAPATITLTANASDPNGIGRVEFYQGTSLIGTSTTAPYGGTWANVPAGVYTVTAKAYDTLGVMSTSAAAVVTVTTTTVTLPSPWMTQDIGAVSPAGSATGNGVAFTVQGAGDDIWNGADAFRFVYQPLTGDGQIVARVASVQNTNGWAKAGVMIREDLSASARQASLVVSPGNGVAFEWRAAPGGASSYVGASGSVPQWLKLVRSGSSISGYTSTTGGTWTLVATTTLSAAATVYVGLAVTSHANGSLCNAGFDNVAISSSGGNTPPTVTMTTPAEGATAVAPATIGLGATAIDSNGIDHVEFYQGSTLIGSSTNGRGDGSQAYTVTWSNVGAGTYTLTAKAFDTLGATTTSGPVHITVSNAASGVPSPWATQDIGAVSPAGSATGDGVAFTVQGAGDDIWNGADAFRFVYEPLTGDGQIVARVASVQNTNGWAKAGVMIREDLSASARQASLIVSPGNGVAFEWRAAPGSASSYVGASGSAPQWLKLVRTGTTISAYVSSDGSTWTPVGTTTLNTGSTVYIGLAVTSHANGVLCTATFDSVGF